MMHDDVATSAAFSPDGRRIVTASWDKAARIWDAADGRAIATLAGHEGEVYSAAFSPDGRRIVTASWDKTARIWDAVDGRYRHAGGARGGGVLRRLQPGRRAHRHDVRR